jgi:aspartate kinase
VSVVMKFGGTSVADPDAINRLIGIVRQQQAKTKSAPLVVVSALSGVTDTLAAITQLAEDGASERAAADVRALLERHISVATAVTSESRARVLADVRREIEELNGLVHALSVLREVSPRSRDAVYAAGELVSSRIVAAAFADHGIASSWVDARTVLITDAEHNAAAPDTMETCERARDRLAPLLSQGRVVVLGGFIGATANGITSTLGRGGSDYSAAIFGSCLGVDEIQIWTDVDGMLTADPRIVPQPRLVPQLSFAEASELAYFGAKVLHPSTILPAVERNIPVRILNSRKADAAGTMITAEPPPGSTPLTALACKRDVTVVDITSSRMLMAYGFLRRVFEVFERYTTAVDVVTTSEVTVSVTVDDRRHLEAIVEALSEFSQVTVEHEMALLCAVGDRLRNEPAIAARAVGVLEEVPLRMISQAASRRNITVILRQADLQHAMNRLHEEFFG